MGIFRYGRLMHDQVIKEVVRLCLLEKTEKATPKRKQDERKKGNVFQSQDVTIVFSLLATFFGFKMLAPSILNSIELSLTEFLGLAGSMKEVTMADAVLFF